MEITFGIYENESKDAIAVVNNNTVISIRLLIKCPKRYFHSLYNDAWVSFKEQYPQYL